MKTNDIKFSLVIIGMIMTYTITIAQNQIWTVGNQSMYFDPLFGLVSNDLPSFDPNGPSVDGYYGFPPNFASNAYHNPVTGQLLFFVVDGYVYDNDGYLINDLSANLPDYGVRTMTGMSTIHIIPFPNDCSKFYIIGDASRSAFYQNPSGGATVRPRPFYAILDLSLDRIEYNVGRKGELLTLAAGQKIQPLWDLVPVADRFEQNPNNQQVATGVSAMAITPKNNNGEHFIFYLSDRGVVYNFKLNSNGISYIPQSIFYAFAGIHPSDWLAQNNLGDLDSHQNGRAEIEVFQMSNGNYRLIGRDSYDSYDLIFKMDYTSNGEVLYFSYQSVGLFEVGSPSIPRPYIKGLEVSPNQEYLYYSTTDVNSLFPKALHCLDLNTFTAVQLPLIPVLQANEFINSMIETNSQGSMILANANGLHQINDANDPANATISTVANFSIPLSNFAFGSSNLAFDIYLLPAQMDFDPNCQIGCYSYTCGDGSADESCCNFYSAFVPNSFHDIVVSGITTWEPGGVINGQTIPTGNNVTLKIEGNITILPGATLNINDLRLEFSPTSKIIVSRGATTSSAGAQLNVNNSTLTVWENCGDCYMWQGVEVSGYAQIASSLPQGKVEFSNNTVVEYAYMGVVNSNMNGTMSGNQDDFSLNPDFNTTGGRITAVQTTFRNNMHDAVFWPYNHSHQSLFDRCLFITNSDLKTDLVSYPIHILTTNSRSIFIVGGRFENETDLAANPQNRGMGILSANSQVAINPYGTIQDTRFNNLETGIYAVSTNSPYSLLVNQAEFNNNINGIYARGENRSIILNSEFRVFRALSGQATYGILFDGCNAYRVEDNVFTGVNPLSSNSHNNFGALVTNSGPYANVIEKNDFTNLRVGAAATGVNAENYMLIDLTNPPKGLQWLCNNFSDNVDDIVVRNGTIAPHQGNCFSLVIPPSININIMRPTGNTFLTNSAGNYHISMSANVPAIKYFYNDMDAFNEPLTYTSNVTPIPCMPSPDDIICGRTFRDGEGQGFTLSNLIDKRDEYFDERSMIEENIDFGNRDSVMMQVLDPYISASEKRDMLNSGITTVSDEVLINYMNSNPPSNMLYQVLQHNSPLSDKVIYVMMEEADMPNGMKQQILLIQSGLSSYEACTQVLQEIQLELNAIESEIIEKYLTDSTGVYSILDVVALYENTPIKDELYQERLFAAYVGANMSNQADSLASFLKANKNDLNYSFFMDLTVQSISMNYFDILNGDSTIIENLEMLAEGDDYYFAPRARAILSGYLGYKFDIELPEESGTKSMQIPQYTYDGSIYEPITIFPNPASDHFFIVFDEYADVSPQREARVYDLAGHLQFTRSFDDKAYVLEINTENMTKGMYIVVISENGTDIGTYKVAVR